MQYLDTLASAYPAHPISVILFLIMLFCIFAVSFYLLARTARLAYRFSLLCRNHFYPTPTTPAPSLIRR